MERLWAPWRMQYILGEKQASCVFCDAFADNTVPDEEYLIIHRGTHCVVIMNLFPYSNGHLLIVPTAHQSTFEGLPPEALLEVMTLINKAVSVLRQAMNAEGFNIGVNLGRIAGAGIGEHVHTHVLPRWAGDTNFTTTLGGTRCIPQDLKTSYHKIKTVWDQKD